MKTKRMLRKEAILVAAAVLVLAAATARAQEISYDGQFTLSPVGDLDMVLKLTLPMERYQALRDSVSNLYLFTRELASNRSDVEITQKKAEWDDASRTVTFTFHMLGAAKNMGNRWVFEVGPGAAFSNIDEGKKAVYFNESGTGPAGPVKGTDRLQLPARATQAKYDASQKAVTYILPQPSSGVSKSALLLPGLALIVIGLGVFGASIVTARKPSASRPAP